METTDMTARGRRWGQDENVKSVEVGEVVMES